MGWGADEGPGSRPPPQNKLHFQSSANTRAQPPTNTHLSFVNCQAIMREISPFLFTDLPLSTHTKHTHAHN